MRYILAKSKKIAAVILALTLLASALSSCGIVIINKPGDEESLPEKPPAPESTTAPETGAPETSDEITAETTAAPAETIPGYTPYDAPDYYFEAKKHLDALPDYDFGGVAVNIAATSSDSYTPAEASNEVNEARFKRNALFEEKYNARVITTPYDKAQLRADAKASYLADSYLADILSIPMIDLGGYLYDGSLMSQRSLPFTDFTAPYFNSDFTKAASAGSGMWASLGEANRNDYHLYCMYFNRDMAAALSLPDLYDLVRSGGWTWDKLLEFSAAAASIDGKSGHGSTLSTNGYIDLLAASMGEPLSSSGVGVIPTSVTSTDKMAQAVAKMKTLFASGSGYLASPETALNAFYGGSMLFFPERLTVASWINDMREDWGLLPLPKYDETQAEYSSYSDGSQPVFVVLGHTENLETTAHFIMGYNAASYGYIAEEFKNTLMLRTLRDNASVEMLDYVTKNVYFDFALLAGGIDYVTSSTNGALRDAVTGNAYTLATLVRARVGYMDYRMRNIFRVFG